jgi:hypothetical protein
MVIEVADFVERDSVKQRQHVVEAVDGHTDFAHLTIGTACRSESMPQLRGQIKGHRQASLP